VEGNPTDRPQGDTGEAAVEGSPVTEPGHFDLNAAIAAAMSGVRSMAADAPPPPAAAPAPPAADAPSEPPVEASPRPAPEPAQKPEPVSSPATAPRSTSPAERGATPASFSPERARRLFGPHGEDIAWLLDSLPSIDGDTARQIDDAYGAVEDRDRDAADTVLASQFSGAPFNGWMQAAEDLVGEWAGTVDTSAGGEAYEVVKSAALDAVDALILQDRLDDRTYATLYGPWESVMDTSDDAAPDAQADAQADEDAEAEKEEEAEFGPNTDLLVQFFGYLRHLTEAQIDGLVKRGTREWERTVQESRNRCDAIAAEKPRWSDECGSAADEIDAWVAGRQGRHFDYAGGAGTDQDREAARTAVYDAATALVMADLLDYDDAAALYASWGDAVGGPRRPED